jgi:hypothetical protein
MKISIIIFSIFLILSCSVFNPATPKMVRNTSTITIVENPHIKTDGYARWYGDVCFIELKRYPVCLAHEVRHCLEEHFHPEGIYSSEDCN